MATIQALKMRIDSIKKTAAITKAMHQIAASKLSSTQNLLDQYRYFQTEFDKVLNEVLPHISNHQLIKPNKKAKKRLYVLITSDRGLAGSYHQQLFNAFLNEVKEIDKEEIVLLVIGKKGYYFALKNNFEMINDAVISNRDQLTIVNYTKYIDLVEKLFIDGKIKDVTLVFNHFVNALKQEVSFETLLPLQFDVKKEVVAIDQINKEYLFEGKPEDIFESLVLIYLQSRIYGVMVDAKLSEFSSRIIAMKQATDNSNEVLSALSLKYHQARQQKITNDLLDISNGKQA